MSLSAVAVESECEIGGADLSFPPSIFQYCPFSHSPSYRRPLRRTLTAPLPFSTPSFRLPHLPPSPTQLKTTLQDLLHSHPTSAAHLRAALRELQRETVQMLAETMVTRPFHVEEEDGVGEVERGVEGLSTSGTSEMGMEIGEEEGVEGGETETGERGEDEDMLAFD